MEKPYQRAVMVLLLLTAVLLLTQGNIVAQSSLPSAELFIVPKTAVFPQQAMTFPTPETIRGRIVQVDLDNLKDQETQQISRQIRLNLFADKVLIAIQDQLQLNPSGSYSWIGHIQNAPESSVILIVRDSILTGNILYGTEQYEIRFAGNMLHTITQVNNSRFPETDEEESDVLYDPPPLPTTKRAPAAPSAADDGSIIDVVVAYTDDTRVDAGSTAAIESIIEAAVVASNNAYANSNVTQRINLAYMGEVSFAETVGDYGPALNAFQNPSDGLMDQVHTWRDTYHADLMMLMVKEGGGCGRAYMILPALNTAYEAYGFAVTRYDCAVGNLTFPHEFGHLMGARHDWFVDDNNNAMFEYNHGYSHIGSAAGSSFRTVMAYGNHCSTVFGSSCVRLPYWSNPNVTYNGNATGNSTGGTNCITGSTANFPCKAQNFLTLNNTAPTIDGFRSSEIVWTGNNSTDWGDANNWIIQEGAPGSTTAVNRIPRSIDSIRIPTAPSSGNYPFINGGTYNARNILLETGATLTITDGTLNVYANWEEQGTAQTNTTGGTINFVGSFNQTIATTADSNFHHLGLGDSSTKTITLQNNLDVDGNLTIANNTTFAIGNHTLTVAGDWSNANANFDPQTSSIIFDGTATQTIRSIGSAKSYLVGPEEFEGTFPPANWSRNDNTGNGHWQLNTSFSGTSNVTNGSGQSAASKAYSTSNSVNLDNELRSPSFTVPTEGAWLQYQNNFQDWNGNGDASLDISSDGGANWTMLTFWTSDYGPTVETVDLSSYAGQTVMLRWRYTANNDSAWYWQIDDVEVYTFGWDGDLPFYNLTVTGDEVVFMGNSAINNNLLVEASGMLNLGTNAISVEGNVTNNGTLKQTKNVAGPTTFLEISNATNSVAKYFGVRITPAANPLGATTVLIKGNQDCTTMPTDPLLNRCYDITPTNAETATIRYYYSSGELNGQTWNNLTLWDWHNGAWVALASGNDTYGTGCANDAGCWGEWTGVDTYSPMVLGTTTVPAGTPAGVCAAPMAPTTLTLNAATSELSWSGGTADSYEVWRSTDTAYFTPTATCTSSPALTCVVAASPHFVTGSSVSTNYYYKVVAVNSCGLKTPGLLHVGDFSFELMPGTP